MKQIIASLRKIIASIPHRTLILASSGMGTFAIIVGVLVLLLPGSSAPAHKKTAILPATSTATLLPTITATSTPVPPTATPVKLVVPPTATPVPRPLPVPKSAPPPVHNPAPTPAPTATPVPTATTMPPTATPAGTPLPCGGSTTCDTPLPDQTATAVPPPTATPGPCQPGGAPYYTTPTALPSNSDIANALSQAGSQYSIPAYLMDAIAWQESGWQPNIIACDGGIGLMQVMPATANWLNSYYSTGYDPYSYTGSAYLGAQYLRYYYLFYTSYLQQNSPSTCGAGGCTWTTIWPSGGASILDIVISVYNEGSGVMGTYGIVNCSYVQNVLLWIYTRYSGPQYSYTCGT